MPVFKPNDYFFEHHSIAGEEKWQTYMRVVRLLMAEELGFPLSDAKLEDKFKYKSLLYPEKGGRVKSE